MAGLAFQPASPPSSSYLLPHYPLHSGPACHCGRSRQDPSSLSLHLHPSGFPSLTSLPFAICLARLIIVAGPAYLPSTPPSTPFCSSPSEAVGVGRSFSVFLFCFAVDPLFRYLNRIPEVLAVEAYVDDTTIIGNAQSLEWIQKVSDTYRKVKTAGFIVDCGPVGTNRCCAAGVGITPAPLIAAGPRIYPATTSGHYTSLLWWVLYCACRNGLRAC